jgi:vancomycin permeability regulator SanA
MIKKLLIISSVALGLFLVMIISCNYYILSYSKPFIFSTSTVPTSGVVLVLGAKVNPPNIPSLALQDRLDTALDLYNNNKVSLFLVSGDHGTKDYDEVNTMKQYLLDHDVPKEKIFLDHAGFDTYDSFYRARDIFQVTSTIVVTQEYHLPRSLYIGRELGITTYGINAERTWFPIFSVREVGARVKAIWNIMTYSKPKFLGETIPITGEAKNSWDEKY